MAIANLSETIRSSILRRNELNLKITTLSNQKNLAAYSQADVQSLKNSETHAVRSYFKGLYEDSPELQEKYKDYTEIPDCEDEIDKLTAKFQEELDELTAWETTIDAQITTCSAELQEVNAFLESYKSMLSSNIQEDFDYSLG